jgi:hypothetical protein
LVRRRGSALLIALMVAVIIFVAGIALVFQFRSDYQQRIQSSQWAQAKAFAQAGLEDFRVKLERDFNFPPRSDVEQTIFEYREQIAPEGGFQVRSDVSLRRDPWQLVLVRSRGYFGSVESPTLIVALEGEFDVSPVVRGSTTLNPQAFQFRLLSRDLLHP